MIIPTPRFEFMEQDFVNTVTNVSVEWILKNVSSSIDGFTQCSQCGDIYSCNCGIDIPTEVDWNGMIESKFGECTDKFIDSVMAEGFHKPICLVWRGEQWCHGNGHHRMALAILLAMDEIPVVFSFQHHEYMMSWATHSNDVASR